jgi:hypothetical protein
VRIERAHVDYGGNCGNMSSAMGPFAVDEGLVPRPKGSQAVVRIHNTSTKKIIDRGGYTVDAVAKLDWAGNGVERLEVFASAKDGHIAIVEQAPED